VVDVDYILENSTAIVRLWCKDEKGKNVLVEDSTFKPYFYVQPKDGKLAELKKRIENLNTKELDIEILKIENQEKNWKNQKTKLIKITIDNPRDIPLVRDVIKKWDEVEETYEYSISFYKRYLIDKQIEPMNWIEAAGEEIKKNYQVDKTIKASSVKPIKLEKEIDFRILAFDTEWVEENGKSVLIMLSIADNEGYKKVLTRYKWKQLPKWVEILKDEKEIIEKFLEIIKEKNPDFVVGYNTDQFDMSKLRETADELKLELKLSRDGSNVEMVRRGRISSAKSIGRVHIDLFDFIDHILSASLKSEVLTLDSVAQELLGTGKKEMKYKEMIEIWKTKEELERLAEYNLHDSVLTLQLAQYILPQIFALCKLTGQTPFDASRLTYSQLVELFFMRRAFADNVLIPNQPKQEEIEERRMKPAYRGAIVIEPTKGIHSNILVFDFRSLYPTIIVTHNIDPWTFNCGDKDCKANKVPETKYCFCTKIKGFIPKHLEELIESRNRFKEQMKKTKKYSEEYKRLNNEQYALKILANATYGYMAFFSARWYKRECGESAAAFGRMYIQKVIEIAKKEGFEIIYGDTDSLMVRFSKELPRDKLEEIGEKFHEKVNKQLPGILELEFRDLYESGIFVATKEETKGAKKRYALINFEGNLEVRGFETVRRDWCELSKKIQRDVLTIILRNKDPAKAIQLIRDTIKEIKEGKVSLDELIIFEQITKPLSQYEQIGPHVKAAQKLRDKGIPVGEGSVIGFVIVKGSGSISDRAMPVDFVKPNQYDPEYYINNQILPASMRVLKALGYTEEEVLTGKVQKKLEAWTKK
jgi:DNA polymerase I/DNA polymerase-2